MRRNKNLKISWISGEEQVEDYKLELQGVLKLKTSPKEREKDYLT